MTNFSLLVFIASVLSGTITATTCVLRDPLPAHCGVSGHVRPAHEFIYPCGNPQIVSNVGECASLCARREVNSNHSQPANDYDTAMRNRYCFCGSIQYDVKDKLCQLGQESVSHGVVKSPNSTSVFYDHRSCFKCTPAFCDQPFGEQLLDNPGFEEKLLGPWITNNGRITKGYKSSRAFSAYNAYLSILSQSTNMCEGALYRLDFDFLPSGVYNDTYHEQTYLLEVSWGGYRVFGSFIAEANTTRQPLWQHGRIYTTVQGIHTGPDFAFSSSEYDEYRLQIAVDNVKVARVPEPVPKPGAVSILQNGGFETGQLKPFWRYSIGQPSSEGAFDVVAPGLNGSDYALFLQGEQFGVTSNQLTQKGLATTPNTTYVLSFDTLAYGDYAYNLQVAFGHPGRLSTMGIQAYPGFQSISIPFYATGSNVQLSLEIIAEEHSNNITLDNFELVEAKRSAFT